MTIDWDIPSSFVQNCFPYKEIGKLGLCFSLSCYAGVGGGAGGAGPMTNNLG